MQERTLKWCFSVIKKRIWLLIFIIIICGIVGYYISSKIEPEYEISAIVLIEEPKLYSNNQIVLNYKNYNAVSSTISAHFASLLKMESVIEEIIDSMGLDMNYEDFIEKMDIQIIDSPNILKIKIRNENLKIAEEIFDRLVTVSLGKAEEILGINNIEITDEHQVHVLSKKTKKRQELLLSIVFGTAISFLLIFLLEYLDKTIKTLEDIKYHSELETIGIICNSIKNDSLIICEEPDSFAAETYRNIVIDISSMQRNEGIKTIVFTSPSSNKYKSAITANIAIALSRTGQKVLLIDGDMRESNISNLFDIRDKKGLSDIIDENISLNDIIIQFKPEENLYILPSGNILSNPADLLALESIKTLLRKLEKIYDLILVDSPFLKTSADTMIFSTITDGTVLICEAGKTKIEDIKQGKKKLKLINSNILGTLLQIQNPKDYEYIINNS